MKYSGHNINLNFIQGNNTLKFLLHKAWVVPWLQSTKMLDDSIVAPNGSIYYTSLLFQQLLVTQDEDWIEHML